MFRKFTLTAATALALTTGQAMAAEVETEITDYAFPFEGPVRPPIATWSTFKGSANLMDRPFHIVADQRAIRAHFCDLTTG